jgi:hypothetical protein
LEELKVNGIILHSMFSWILVEPGTRQSQVKIKVTTNGNSRNPADSQVSEYQSLNLDGLSKAT